MLNVPVNVVLHNTPFNTKLAFGICGKGTTSHESPLVIHDLVNITYHEFCVALGSFGSVVKVV